LRESMWVAAIGFKRFLLELADRAHINVLLIDEIAKVDFSARDKIPALLAFDLNAEFDTLLAAVDAWRHRHPIASVLSMSDSTLLIAARLNQALQLPGISVETTELLLDKAKMRERMAQRGLPTISWARIASLDELIRFQNDVRGPVILKPIDGEASRNVYRLGRQAAEASALWSSLSDAGERGWIAEELLEGPEFSVETVTESGRHHVLAITGKYKGKNFVETGHQVPAELSSIEAKQIADAVREFLSAMGLEFGIAHTEVIVTTKGPKIVESQNRVGGDRIGRLVEFAAGIHPVQWMLERLLGRPVALGPEMSCSRGAAIRFLTPEPGRVISIDGIDAARQVAGVGEVEVTATIGGVVRPLRSSNDRTGHVLAKAATSRLAYEACCEAVGRIRIEVAEETATDRA
jgi:biotin carboxylase